MNSIAEMEKMSSADTSLCQYQSFIELIIRRLKVTGIVLSELGTIDHIAIRTGNLESYEASKSSLQSYAKKVSETIISNRPIAVFKINKPLNYKQFSINAVELMAPKPDIHQSDGLDHIEFLLLSPFEEFINSHPGVPFDTENLVRINNPTISLSFNDCKVKFHHQDLLSVVELQQKTGEL